MMSNHTTNALCRRLAEERKDRIRAAAALYLKHVHDGAVPTMTELLVDLPEALATLKAAGVDHKSPSALHSIVHPTDARQDAQQEPT